MKLRDYYEVREWLEKFIPLTYTKKNLGLSRIKYLLKLLENPQEKFKSILVGGTSGKGSSAYYLARALSSVNFRGTSSPETPQGRTSKIGLHISPHLAYIGERMQINGKPIAPNKLVELVNEVCPKVEFMEKTKVGFPSYFEILVAVSFLYFAKEKVDWAVVEVGLGGRLDATNVLISELSIITNVGLDHTDILGKTIEEIAREKAGIIKRGIPTVTSGPSTHFVRSGSSISRYNSRSSTSGKALRVIEKVAESKKSPLTTISTLKKKDRVYFDQLRNIKDKIDADLVSGVHVTDECFFLVNLVLNQLGITLSENQQRKVFSARFAARFEEIDEGILIDGAHNKDKAQVLIKWVKKISQRSKVKGQKSKIILVCAFKKGKDWKGILRLLVKNLDIERAYATQFVTPTDTGFFSSVAPKEIKSYLESKNQGAGGIKGIRVRTFGNSQEAAMRAILERDKGNRGAKGARGIVLVTGSLYLAGEARTLWKLPEF